MEEKDRSAAIQNLEAALKKINDKSFRLYFYVFDSKGMPSGSLVYIYDIALTLKNMGYNVQMLYNDKEFVGVSEWLGEEYASLPHQSIDKGKTMISPADFLFIPEIYSTIMAQTMKMPCKRIVIVQNTHYLCDTLPFTGTYDNMKIYDCITTSEALKVRLTKWFPKMNIMVIKPSIAPIFKPSDKPQKMVVNFVGKSHDDVNEIVKPFYWRYPSYKWVGFRDLREMPREEFAKALQEGSITVWVDDKTDFGHSLLESMACNNLIIGKVPENEPEWLVDENGVIKDNGLWFFKSDDAPELIANAVETVINDAIPNRIYSEMAKTIAPYTKENQKEDIQNVLLDGIFSIRKKELEIAYKALKNVNKSEDKKEEE